MGSKISFNNGKLIVPNDPIIGFIEGDGTGPDIWHASQPVFDAAVKKASNGSQKVVWEELYAGEKAFKEKGEWLPKATLNRIKEIRVAIKGPLTTPVGGGIRSLNVALRQELDLYSCVRPVRWFTGVGAPVKHPEKVNMVIFRENTEDIYKGIEFPVHSENAKKFISLCESLGYQINHDSGIGIKPVSISGTKRLMRAAVQYAIDNKQESVTIVHKGNIMKFTEGGFRDWAYEVAKQEFGDKTVTEEETWKGASSVGKVIIKDRIADAMLQQILLRPEEYSVIATLNLNGDYISDALAAQVGGLGLAPGANISDQYAIFEATHGTAPKYAGQDKVNPSSVILSGVMMFRHLGWTKAADLIENSIEKVISQKTVTYDLARQMENAKTIKCSEFGAQLVKAIESF